MDSQSGDAWRGVGGMRSVLVHHNSTHRTAVLDGASRDLFHPSIAVDIHGHKCLARAALRRLDRNRMDGV